ncbi:MAG: acyl-CoA ligase (AMP-forming), exosortase A system-associated [Halieaceae bacterium]|nr:acyl-CoA ligase (AMP-forming), exosortase A system-associated [Halieaceae bacterium]
MADLIHEFISEAAQRTPEATALIFKGQSLNYDELHQQVNAFSGGLMACGIGTSERVAVYLPKQNETVFALFGAAAAGACFVPINPLLKPRQVAHVLPHCNVKVLVTSAARLRTLQPILRSCPDLHTIVLVDAPAAEDERGISQSLHTYRDFCLRGDQAQAPHRVVDTDLAAILYTSGSTGKPKGVVLSHRNMVAGANSVAGYLGNTSQDKLLAVLPLSFDAGLSQLTTAFSVSACAVLMDYLLPRDVIRAVEKHGITGLTAVPPLWNQLKDLKWSKEAASSMRYIANTGGAMPVATTRTLQQALPNTLVYLMYGLTEAFRSTYLPPDQVDKRPESIGKAIPNAEILVINDLGKECSPNEPGELVHRGALVSLGYWNDPEKTAERFKPCPGRLPEIISEEMAVWSGDQVTKDEDGYLYFISRKDEMIKTSGYRVSPTEVEEVAFASGLAAGAAALGIAHPTLGQAILLLVTPAAGQALGSELEAALLNHCRAEMPNFMVPAKIVARELLPQNQNGKIDRRALSEEYQNLFQEASE